MTEDFIRRAMISQGFEADEIDEAVEALAGEELPMEQQPSRPQPERQRRVPVTA